jgi:glycosidase
VSQPKGLDLIRMYSLIPLAAGKVGDWTKGLVEIKKLGFDCVHLLPITQMGYSQSPYSASNLKKVDSMYADSDEVFKDFLKKSIELEIRLCFDLVLNHINPESELAKNNPDWIKHDKRESDGFKRAGCWHENQWIRWSDLVLINYDHPDENTRNEIWERMLEYTLLWAGYAAQTKGMIRLDNLHSSNEDFMTYVRKEVKNRYPDLIIFAEFFADDQTLLNKSLKWDLNLLLGQPWHFDFVPQLRNYIKKIHKEGFQLHQLMPINTHDTPSVNEMYSDSCYTIPRYAINAFFTCGMTGLTMGAEQGEESKMEFIGTPYVYNIFKPHNIKEHIKEINDILARESIMRKAGNIEFIDHDHEALMVAIRKKTDDSENDTLIAVSMDKNNKLSFRIDLSDIYENCEEVNFNEVYHKESPALVKHGDEVEVTPCNFRIFYKTN